MILINRSKRPQFLAQDMAIVRDIVSSRNTSINNLSLAEVVIPPGSSTLEHYHKESEEIFYILEGNGNISVVGESCQINAGDTIVILPGEKHRVVNDGNKDFIFLAICSPGYRDDDQIIVQSKGPELHK
jgi:mannose-6-phosphate isomerase-like protein (cupin superfamily)